MQSNVDAVPKCASSTNISCCKSVYVPNKYIGKGVIYSVEGDFLPADTLVGI